MGRKMLPFLRERAMARVFLSYARGRGHGEVDCQGARTPWSPGLVGQPVHGAGFDAENRRSTQQFS